MAKGGVVIRIFLYISIQPIISFMILASLCLEKWQKHSPLSFFSLFKVFL